MYVIGIDLGTQSMKGLLVDPEGNVVAEASHSHDPSYPNPGWAEQNTADWLHSFRCIIADLLEQSQIDPEEIGTIGFDSQVDGAVPVDKDGNVLRNALIWLDRRAEAETKEIGTRISAERVFELTGLNLDSSHVAPKLAVDQEQRARCPLKGPEHLLPAATWSAGSPARTAWITPTPPPPCSTMWRGSAGTRDGQGRGHRPHAHGPHRRRRGHRRHPPAPRSPPSWA